MRRTPAEPPGTRQAAGADAPVGIDRRGWQALALAAASYVTILDNLGLAVAFPTIEKAFPHFERTTLAWDETSRRALLARYPLPNTQAASTPCRSASADSSRA